MPELPALQALAERLDRLLAGSVLEELQVLQFSALKTVAPPPSEAEGRALRAVGRRGKFLLFELGEPPGAGAPEGPGADGAPEGPGAAGALGGLRLAVHLAQGGRVTLEDPPRRRQPSGGVVRLRFEARPALVVREYGTQRRAGLWVLAPGEEGPLKALGPEPGTAAFAEVILRSEDRRHLHTILRDQRTVAGIGRGYADEILHRARLSPFAALASLSPESRHRLLDAVAEVLDEALAAERSRRGGLPPKLDEHFTVHGRWGYPCPRCGADLRRVSYESREVTYCPPCQTGGRVLADRRLSRLVR